MKQISLNWEPERRILSVTEITGAIRGLLEKEFGEVWVAGEISGFKRAASGHLYFTLKDSKAQLQCACWRGSARSLRFQPEDGVAVLARGRIDVYPPRGQYQLIVDALEPQGVGALQLAFEQLKKKLAAEGLFADDRKRPLPPFPDRIGIVTSPSGAAIRDMVQVLGRRAPGVKIRLYPARVQGEGSAAEVVEGIEYLGASGWPDLIIVGRGGGSLEDLWTFNEEEVARAIAASPVPVVSAVGHETDFTIADFVADLRAPTPSAAAELVAPDRSELAEKIAAIRQRLGQFIRFRIADASARLHQRGTDKAAGLLRQRLGQSQQRVDELSYRMHDYLRGRLDRERRRWRDLEARLARRDLRLQLAAARRRLESSDARIAESFRRRLSGERARFDSLAAQLQQLSPLSVLERGYAIVQDGGGQLVRSSRQAPPETELKIRLAEGRLRATVDESLPAGDEPSS